MVSPGAVLHGQHWKTTPFSVTDLTVLFSSTAKSIHLPTLHRHCLDGGGCLMVQNKKWDQQVKMYQWTAKEKLIVWQYFCPGQILHYGLKFRCRILEIQLFIKRRNSEICMWQSIMGQIKWVWLPNTLGFIKIAGLWCPWFYTSQSFSDVMYSTVSNSCLGTDRLKMNHGLEKR